MEVSERAAFVMAAAARALIRAQGMTALNMQRQGLGQSMAYDDEAFFALIDEEGIGHNSVVMALRP